MGDRHGTIHWNELNTRDPKAAMQFYKTVCGWEFDTMPMEEGGDYHVARQGDNFVAGIFDMSAFDFMADMPPHWFTYIAVDDIDKSVDAVTAEGGTVIRPPWDVAGVGRIAIVKDNTGAAIGFMTPADPQG